MAVDRKPVIALAAMLLVLPILSVPAYASESEWKTAYSVGKFDYVNPPKPDQIFKIQYRVTNGTIDDVHAKFGFSGNINTTADTAILEIKYPRNYPYTNSEAAHPLPPPIVFVNGLEIDAPTDPEITDCFFEFSVPLEMNGKVEIVWTILPTNRPFHGDGVPDYCIPETVVQGVAVKSDGTISPYHQFKAGVSAQGIVCEGFLELEQYMLVIHPDGRPFCVTRESATDLIQRWGVTISA
ncbi:hypothetical protein [Nitrososphaera sp.]|uniref:hypothetical protein n=1 Tax=Nitrososphaera sp. TaxID=1971748 RepID=UPI0031748C17